MRAKLKLKPGQRGAKKMMLKYGAKLVCVRYRYDAVRFKRYETVALIEEEIPWRPKLKAETVVEVEVKWGEKEMAWKVKQAGGIWDATKKVWKLRYDKVVALGIQDRIVWRVE